MRGNDANAECFEGGTGENRFEGFAIGNATEGYLDRLLGLKSYRGFGKKLKPGMIPPELLNLRHMEGKPACRQTGDALTV